jgi:3-oxoacyl-[acyl-carrier-protein] synthase-3
MNGIIRSVITGTGSYIPNNAIANENFLTREFYESNGERIQKSNQEIIDKFLDITTIAERRYADDDMLTSDMATLAAKLAIEDAGIDPEELDYVILGHNFGDIQKGTNRVDILPALAARVKHNLGIKNPAAVAYDVIFGCPGWLQCLIQADYYIRSGDAKKILVIGADILSRIYDPHDRDSMIYADGAGAVIVEAREGNAAIGIQGHASRSDTLLHSKMLFMGCSYHPNDENRDDLYLKMNGRRLYQYALENVPASIKQCLDKCGVSINDVKKVLIHQANGKMDDAILKRLYQLYDIANPPEDVMPMTIERLGNSSVATLPTLLDLILRNQLGSHRLESGDTYVLASVGAGMHINAMIYTMP